MSTAAILHPTTTNSVRIYRKEARYEFVKLLRTRSFSLATIGFPVMFYVLFGIVNKHSYEGGVHIAKYMLAGYACFGLIGSALFGIGVGLSSDLAAGWLELKRSSPMPVAAYLFAKCAAAVAFGLIIVSILTLIGISFGDVHLSPSELFKMLGLTIVGSICFASMGLLIALLVPANAAPGIINLIYLPMSYLSGLWVPIQFMPRWLQHFAPVLPTYHLSQLMLSIFHYGDSMSLITHWNALIGFTLLMLGISSLIFHRKEQNA
ncbi:ABC transporter permease [Granulicella sp. S190]|uniref:ABC transporter permease n=1 Tax=Granulicella sp. S190 TaxID=1747226 RepID=UPI00131E342B|nr:ABC transporter permease [Granulicella sp. S190]